MAIRAALGAGRLRLMAQLLAQTLVLALIGGAGRLQATYWSMDGLVALAHGVLPRLNESRTDWRVLVFTVAASFATGMLFGLSPAIGVSRASLRDSLNMRGGVVSSGSADRRGNCPCVRLAGWRRPADAEFSGHPRRGPWLRTDQIRATPSHYSTPQNYNRFLTDVLEQVCAVPGVVPATATLGVPMVGSAGGNFEVFGRAADTSEKPDAAIRPGDSEYLSTLGIALERGRSFTPRDGDEAPPVALINEKLARQFFIALTPILIAGRV